MTDISLSQHPLMHIFNNKEALLKVQATQDFLVSALVLDITDCETGSDKKVINKDLAKKRFELIKLVVETGFDFNDFMVGHYFPGFKLDEIAIYKENWLELIGANNLMAMIFQFITWGGDVEHRFDKGCIETQKSLLLYAIENGVDLNAVDDLGCNIVDKLLAHKQFEALDSLLKQSLLQPTQLGWAIAVGSNLDINYILEVYKRFPEFPIYEEIYQILRSHGVSHNVIQDIFDIYNLTKDLINTLNHTDVKLSDDELSLLDANSPAKSIEYYDNVILNNNYGFKLIHLALLGGKLDLIKGLINHGHSLIEMSKNGLTALSLVFEQLDRGGENIEELLPLISNHIDNVDIILNEIGDSVLDKCLSLKHDICLELLNKSNDSLFTFIKEDANAFSTFEKDDKIHIAISHGDSFWSTGVNSVARLIIKEYPNVLFHLVTMKAIEEGGEAFIAQFDGWINPGAGDSYPRGKEEFTKAEWNPVLDTELIYQKALGITSQLNMPTLGMCAGAQNLALYHGGSLRPLENYAQGAHTIIHLAGTLVHFMAMTKQQQKLAILECALPKIIFEGDTAHHFAAVTYKLGEDLELGAISEDGVAMAYAHKNGLRYATQFHPEHYYYEVDTSSEINHQKVWLNNFIHLVTLYHNNKEGEGVHPQLMMEAIQARLEECIEAPTCMADIYSTQHNATLFEGYFI